MTPGPSLLRRMAAIGYDCMLLFSVLFFATVPVLLITRGETINPNNPLYTAYIIGICFLYFGWQWIHGGQTLGMKAWKIRMVNQTQGPVSWRSAFYRFIGSVVSWIPLGAGFLWVLFDREGLTWHDRLSGTRLILTEDS